MAPLVLCAALFCFYFWNSAGVYRDRNAVLAAMLRLQIHDEKLTPVGGRPDVLLLKTWGYQTALDHHLAKLGWGKVEWMGSIGHARKGSQQMEVVDESMTAQFRIVGLGHAPYSVRGAR